MKFNINRITVEFKVTSKGKTKRVYFILIESQWNLKYYERLEKEGEY